MKIGRNILQNETKSQKLHYNADEHDGNHCQQAGTVESTVSVTERICFGCG